MQLGCWETHAAVRGCAARVLAQRRSSATQRPCAGMKAARSRRQDYSGRNCTSSAACGRRAIMWVFRSKKMAAQNFRVSGWPPRVPRNTMQGSPAANTASTCRCYSSVASALHHRQAESSFHKAGVHAPAVSAKPSATHTLATRNASPVRQHSARRYLAPQEAPRTHEREPSSARTSSQATPSLTTAIGATTRVGHSWG
jgi:hypothetical protein